MSPNDRMTDAFMELLGDHAEQLDGNSIGRSISMAIAECAEKAGENREAIHDCLREVARELDAAAVIIDEREGEDGVRLKGSPALLLSGPTHLRLHRFLGMMTELWNSALSMRKQFYEFDGVTLGYRQQQDVLTASRNQHQETGRWHWTGVWAGLFSFETIGEAVCAVVGETDDVAYILQLPENGQPILHSVDEGEIALLDYLFEISGSLRSNPPRRGLPKVTPAEGSVKVAMTYRLPWNERGLSQGEWGDGADP